MKAYITKKALTKGIVEIEAKVLDKNRTLIRQLETPYVFTKPDWCETPKEAIARATQMKRAKIASLEKKVSKLKTTFFTPDKIKKV